MDASAVMPSPRSRIVWTNDEGEGARAATTVTFEEKGGKTLLVTSALQRLSRLMPHRLVAPWPLLERTRGRTPK